MEQLITSSKLVTNPPRGAEGIIKKKNLPGGGEVSRQGCHRAVRENQINRIMKRNVRMAIVALAFMAAGSTSALAQSADNNQTQDSSITYRPFQISFVPMLGTNGIESPKVANRLSVNIIAGMSKGVGAAEYGGIANLTNGKVFGFQYAGILNTSKDVTGCQVAGIVNLTRGNVKGLILPKLKRWYRELFLLYGRAAKDLISIPR